VLYSCRVVRREMPPSSKPHTRVRTSFVMCRLTESIQTRIGHSTVVADGMAGAPRGRAQHAENDARERGVGHRRRQHKRCVSREMAEPKRATGPRLDQANRLVRLGRAGVRP
jgi:hypothetical protein